VSLPVVATEGGTGFGSNELVALDCSEAAPLLGLSGLVAGPSRDVIAERTTCTECYLRNSVEASQVYIMFCTRSTRLGRSWMLVSCLG
jgi:hypothetical protein